MEAYLPICETATPVMMTTANDQPWRRLSGTQTVFWWKTTNNSNPAGLSSVSSEIREFFIVNNPTLIGLQRLRAFRSWGDNWDGEGSKAPNAEAVDFASKILGLLAMHRVPAVSLSADGSPMFIYGEPLNGEVVVTGRDRFDYFFAADNAPEVENASLSNNSLPGDLIAYLQSA